MKDWSDLEIEIIVADYFSMLRDEIAGIPFSKTDHRKKIMPLLNGRSDGSIEFKYQHISAVLIRLGVPFINGYKPKWNYRHALGEKVVQFIKRNLSFEQNFKEFAEAHVREVDKAKLIYEEIVEDAPKGEGQLVLEPELTYANPVKINYLEVEQNNKLLSQSGEAIVMKYEQWRLSKAGKDSLSEKVEWVAQTKGDWLGFDVLSKNTNGTDRYIGVKTTKLGKDSPIFFSKGEYEFSARNHENYFLYRVFNFNTMPRMFIVNGKFDDFCQFQPVKFKGYF